MELKDQKMVAHGSDNLAMVWESSDKIAQSCSKPAPVGVQAEGGEAGNKYGHVEGVGHIQRPKHPTSYLETLAHHLKGNVASGMYAMGDAFKNGGILLAPILTVILGVLCVFNQHNLVNCANIMRERNKLNYYPGFDVTVQLCFETGPSRFRKYANLGRSSVNFFIITAQLGFCCVYMVFATSTADQILQHFGHNIDFHLLMVITLVLVLGFILIRNLKYLAPVSMFATLVMMMGVALTVYISSDNLAPVSSRRAIGSLSQLPLFFGTVIYAYEGISLVLPLQIEMKQPEKFNAPLGVLNVGNVIVTFLLLIVGFVGYLKYGEDVEGSLTLNLPDSELMSQWVKTAVAVGMLLTYPIMFYVPVALIWPAVISRWGPFEKPAKYEYILRMLLCLLTFVLAEIVPNLGLFISLVGAVSSTALALVFPPLCDLLVRWEEQDYGLFSWRKMVDYLTLVVAVFGFCTGTYFSLQEIVRNVLNSSVK